jgi:Glycosyltransferase family 87
MSTNKIQRTKEDPRLWLVFLILLPWVLNSIRQSNTDFRMFVDTVHDWVSGETILYDEFHVYFNYLPWALVIYLPFSFLPDTYGLLIFNTLSLGLLIWSTWCLVKPVRWWVLAISLTTFYTGMHMMLGQWDILVLTALTLGWLGVQRKKPWLVGIALIGMTTKYTNIIIPMILLLYAIRHWPFKALIRVAILPMAIIPISFLIAGWDWPLRYSRLMRSTLAIYDHYEVITIFSKTVYQTSYWRYVPPVGMLFVVGLTIIGICLIIRLTRRKLDLDAILLAIPLNLVCTPYLAPQHIIYLAPVQAQLLKNHRTLGVILYGASLVDLILMWFGIGVIIYPLIALITYMLYAISKLRQPILIDQKLY